MCSSLTTQDPFGEGSVFVGLSNFSDLFGDPLYVDAIGRTLLFCACVAGLSMAVALALAVFADREIKGRAIYRTLLIWPYAVAPVISAVLWLFMLNPQVGLLGRWLNQHGIALGLCGQRRPGVAAGGAGQRLEAGQLQFHLFPRRAAIHPARGDRSGADGRRQGLAALSHHHLPAAGADHVLPARGEPGLRRVRYVRARSRR